MPAPVKFNKLPAEIHLVGKMMSDTVAQKVIAAIAKTKKIPAETITLDSTLDELKIDSLDGLNLFFDLEETLDISIPDDKAMTMRNVREIVDGIERLVAQKSEPGSTPSNPS
jgi:acyl carrier protein